MKKIIGNILLVILTCVFFFSLIIYAVPFLSKGIIMFLLVVMGIIIGFTLAVIIVSKLTGLSLKYEKTSFLGRIIPYLFIAYFGMNFLSFLSGFSYVIAIIALFISLFLFGKYAPQNWKNKLNLYVNKWLKIWIIFAIIILIITLFIVL